MNVYTIAFGVVIWGWRSNGYSNKLFQIQFDKNQRNRAPAGWKSVNENALRPNGAPAVFHLG